MSDDIATEHSIKEAIEIYNRLQTNCKDTSIRNHATWQLVNAYQRLGEHDSALHTARSLPPISLSQETAMPHILSGEARLVALQQNIVTATAFLLDSIQKLSNSFGSAVYALAPDDYGYSLPQRLEMLCVGVQAVETIFPNRAVPIPTTVGNCYRIMAALAMETEQHALALDYLEQSVNYLIAGQKRLNDEYEPFFMTNKIKRTADTDNNMICAIMLQTLTSPAISIFDPLKSSSRFERLLKNLTALCK